MAEQIRSADLLVKSALSDPATIADLKQKPEETLKGLAKEATQSLPRSLELEPPSPITSNIIWIVVVISFAIVMLYAAYILGSGVSTKLEKDIVYVTKGETILTVFTTVVAFLAGLLSPSPIKK